MLLAMAGLAVLGILLFTCRYLLKQGWLLLAQRASARPTAELLARPDTPEGLRSLIRRADAIRRFGISDMGLKDTPNYRDLVVTERPWLVTVVSACRPLAFERHTWWFPVFGASPYLGFFDEADAKAEAGRLRREGWEVWVRHVDAFSTLGILRDPLYSFMQEYSDYQLANLILHEQTHASLWAGGAFDFNEQLATFLGDELALEYVRVSAGPESPALREVLDEDLDRRSFYGDVAELRTRLSAIFAAAGSDSEKMAARDAEIERFKAGFGSGPGGRYRTRAWAGMAKLPVNMAFIDLWQTYTGRNALFGEVLQRCGGLREFIALMRKAVSQRDPFAWLEAWMAGGGG